MTDTPDKLEDQASGQPQPDEEEPQLREVSRYELKRILAAHEKWLESDGKEGEQADLHEANLQEAHLVEANLQRANLGGADVHGANLNSANLQGASLNNTNLRGADLIGTNLQEAFLFGANLQEADLVEANLQRANLGGANLQGANLCDANLEKASFWRASLQNAFFYRANLREAHLVDADLQEANLNESNLRGANLSRANLRRTKLIDANLRNARLFGAALHEATLTRADLQRADLTRAEGLAEAELRDANLEGATGLLGTEFARADVTGTKLPEDIREFKVLQTVEETSRNARKIFLAMLLGCAYAWLTVATTTDARLLTNSASSPLPIIRTEIPIAWFYWAAPFILVGLYVYLQFYLERLWQGLAGLPARFPDGKRLDERAYPWLLNGLVRRHFERLKEGRTPIAKFEEWVTIFLAWWAVPATLFGFWLRYLPRHEWWGTGLHIGLLVVSVGFTIIFYHSAAATLRGDERQQFSWKTPWRDRRTYQRAGIVLVGVAFSLLSLAAIQGDPWTRLAFPPLATANLREADVSTKPENWRGKEEDIPLVKGANLRESDLRYADAFKAFLANGNLKGANLQGAYLVSANLQGANLREAYLKGADLRQADLQRANLFGANLQGAFLFVANLQGAVLQRANLQGAVLQRANLQGANLSGANLQGAHLQRAHLQEAFLFVANLQGADLQRASGLTQKQLDNACGDAKTKLPNYLGDYKIKPCPKESK